MDLPQSWWISRLSILLLLSTVFCSTQALAFKVDTHVWVGQQVLNDVVPDGKITIKVGSNFKELEVDPAIVSALRNHPNLYRGGNLGPDAYPDMYTGQMVVHPGIENGWKTDDWLKALRLRARSEEELAFVYGYLSHAAADVFSHTYVNSYAGDFFSLSDGEIEVEKRHILLEKYIEERTPPLVDHQGTVLGHPYNNVAVPAEFIRDNLIFDNEVATQNEKGGAAHLYLVNSLKNSLQDTQEDIREIKIKVADLIAQSQFGINLNDEQIGEVLDLYESLEEKLNQNLIDDAQEVKDKILEKYGEVVADSGELAKKINDEYIDLLTLSGRYEDLVRDLAEAQSNLANTVKEIGTEVCTTVCKPQCWVVCPFCGSICDDVCSKSCHIAWEINPMWVEYNDLVNKLLDEKSKMDNQIQDVKDVLHDSVDLAVDTYIAQLEAENDVLNATIDLAQRYYLNMDPISGHIAGWLADIDEGMLEYVVSSEAFIKATMAGENPLTPLLDWLQCWGPAVAGVIPAPVTTTICSVEAHLDVIKNDIEELQNSLAQLDPVTYLITQLEEKINAEITRLAEDLAWELAERTVGEDIVEVAEIFSQPATPDALNSLFGKDPTGKYLLLINDVAARVNTDLHLTGAGLFDPEQYNAAYNAVVLSKLSLLKAEQLSAFAHDLMGDVTTVYGTTLYGADGSSVSNILFDAVASIDGNHQWQPLGLPYPRRLGDYSALQGDYGYYLNASSRLKGFRLFEDPDAREQVFLKVFRGPIAPGLEIPTDYYLPDILPADYPFRACAEHPFPRTISDEDHITALDTDDSCGGLAISPDFAGGTIEQNSFILSNTTYHFTESLYVPAGVTLTVEEGAVLLFDAGTSLIVDGTIVVKGEPGSLVTFSASDQATTAGVTWGGIVINGTVGESLTISTASSSSNIESNIISGAVISSADKGISFNGATGVVSQSIITDNHTGIYVSGNATPTISNGNEITANNYGIYVDGGQSLAQPAPVVTGNNIYENKPFNYYANWFQDSAGVVLDASENWWGSTHLPNIMADIFHAKGNANFAPEVKVEPYLVAPVEN